MTEITLNGMRMAFNASGIARLDHGADQNGQPAVTVYGSIPHTFIFAGTAQQFMAVIGVNGGYVDVRGAPGGALMTLNAKAVSWIREPLPSDHPAAQSVLQCGGVTLNLLDPYATVLAAVKQAGGGL